MVRIIWSSQARADLKAIADYISVDSKYYAKLQVIKLRNRTNILKDNPCAGRLVPEFNNEALRELISGNYRIIYKLSKDDVIHIITIHHSARDLFKRKIQ